MHRERAWRSNAMLLRVTTSFRPSVLSGEIPGLGGDSGSVWRRLRRRYWRISFAGERRDSLVACKRAAKGCVWSVCVGGGGILQGVRVIPVCGELRLGNSHATGHTILRACIQSRTPYLGWVCDCVLATHQLTQPRSAHKPRLYEVWGSGSPLDFSPTGGFRRTRPPVGGVSTCASCSDPSTDICSILFAQATD